MPFESFKMNLTNRTPFVMQVSGFGICESVQPISDVPASLCLSKQSISTLGNAKVGTQRDNSFRKFPIR